MKQVVFKFFSKIKIYCKYMSKLIKSLVDSVADMLIGTVKDEIVKAVKVKNSKINIMLFYDYNFSGNAVVNSPYIRKEFDCKYFSTLKQVINDKFKWHDDYDITLKIACHDKNKCGKLKKFWRG